MKKTLLFIVTIIFIYTSSCTKVEDEWIRINQLGYRNNDIKIAVFLSKKTVDLNSFKLIEVSSGKVAMTFKEVVKTGPLDSFISCYRLPFSDFKKSGTYRIEAGNALSPVFQIGDDVYDGTADFLLNYMRQQRCGFNPYIKDSCHTDDGYEIYGKSADSSHIDVTGGWHDAADYLQYVATSANATYQMLFAYSENPTSFGDHYLPNGLAGTDGLADVLNESRWGLNWLMKMNPEPGIMYNQIADDRDHVGFRFPNKDSVDYGLGRERPVYFCTGEPQGMGKHKNRSTGIASTAGKFSSAFALGAEVYKSIDPQFSETLLNKAVEAFNFGLKNPGVCQTAPGSAPYFYEEDNWVDDMELAAVELYNQTKEPRYLEYAVDFGRQEIVTPWIGSDTARHYQWYPFVNMGHPAIARNQKTQNTTEFSNYMRKGLELTANKAKNNPFNIGIPFIWCSNNLIAGILTQMHLYSEISGDNSFAELEASHRDWLFGCNPWGTSMIVGLPENGDYPEETHSSYVIEGGQVEGGLVDGTACLVYYLSALQSHSKNIYLNQNIELFKGAIVRMDTTRKDIYLCFTAHEFADGFDTIIQTLANHNIKASFFLTGDFCRTPGFKNYSFHSFSEIN